jgi:hypothetical protein
LAFFDVVGFCGFESSNSVKTPLNSALSGLVWSYSVPDKIAAETHGINKMVRDTGFEPVTPTVSMWCSTTELTAHGSFLFSIFSPVLQARNPALRARISF